MCLAIPGRIRTIETPLASASAGSLGREGVVDFGGVERRVSLAFVPEAGVGDYVLVHAGVAIQRLDHAHARAVREVFEEPPEDRAVAATLTSHPGPGRARGRSVR